MAMTWDRIEKLKLEYTDQYVVVDVDRAELARLKGLVGQVKTINFNGCALVQFDAQKNIGWYDIELDYLKVVDKPEPKPAANRAIKKADDPAKEKLSPLELARLEKQGEQAKAKSTTVDAPARPDQRPEDGEEGDRKSESNG